jgi:hypothetical protein
VSAGRRRQREQSKNAGMLGERAQPLQGDSHEATPENEDEGDRTLMPVR